MIWFTIAIEIRRFRWNWIWAVWIIEWKECQHDIPSIKYRLKTPVYIIFILRSFVFISEQKTNKYSLIKTRGKYHRIVRLQQYLEIWFIATWYILKYQGMLRSIFFSFFRRSYFLWIIDVNKWMRKNPKLLLKIVLRCKLHFEKLPLAYLNLSLAPWIIRRDQISRPFL